MEDEDRDYLYDELYRNVLDDEEEEEYFSYDDEEDNSNVLDQISDSDVFSAALDDSDVDKLPGGLPGDSYGHSIDLDKLTDEQRDLYDSEYYGNIDNRIDDDGADF